MRLALSSAAAPDLALEELLDACVRRGLAALEPEAGHAHGIAPGLAPARYGGPLVIGPSTPAYLRAWGAWLGRAGGWGAEAGPETIRSSSWRIIPEPNRGEPT